ncbi:MAG: hypothetical protein O7G85_04255 [Planctomycetota bacterium]|nr:hypothetical protein [Planctomycetota bacterium]
MNQQMNNAMCMLDEKMDSMIALMNDMKEMMAFPTSCKDAPADQCGPSDCMDDSPCCPQN